ncbi:hypothetical protein OKW26_003506 [Paraburkholderia sp. 32]
MPGTNKIPYCLRDTATWATPAQLDVPSAAWAQFDAKVAAVKTYRNGPSYPEIREIAGLDADDVRRIAQRFPATDPSKGEICRLSACAKGLRSRENRYTAPFSGLAAVLDGGGNAQNGSVSGASPYPLEAARTKKERLANKSQAGDSNHQQSDLG